jgi:hypothetical protein
MFKHTVKSFNFRLWNRYLEYQMMLQEACYSLYIAQHHAPVMLPHAGRLNIPLLCFCPLQYCMEAKCNDIATPSRRLLHVRQSPQHLCLQMLWNSSTGHDSLLLRISCRTQKLFLLSSSCFLVHYPLQFKWNLYVQLDPVFRISAFRIKCIYAFRRVLITRSLFH